MSRKEYFNCIYDVTDVLVDIEEEMNTVLFNDILYETPKKYNGLIRYYLWGEEILVLSPTTKKIRLNFDTFEDFRLLYGLTKNELFDFLTWKVCVKHILSLGTL